MSKSSPPRLGKGLSALIGPRPQGPLAAPEVPVQPTHGSSSPPVTPTGDLIRHLPVAQVVPNPRQPRTEFDEASLEELAQSIRGKGVLQPILVRPVADGRFELVAGERRWRAVQRLKLETIPAIVRQISARDAVEIALIENLQREDLGPLERARAYQQYTDTFNATPAELAERLGESRANVVNYVRLLKLPAEIQALIQSKELGMGQARALAGIADPQRQLAVAKLAVRRNLSVRQVEALVQDAPTQVSRVELGGVAVRRHLTQVESEFSKALGLPVRVVAGRKKNSGKVVIVYRNLDEFDRIAAKLGVEALPE
jgi:ParB family chromosome partitioning protein